MNRRYSLYDPFILAQKVRQVYYVPYPKMCKDMCGWYATISTKPRGHVEIETVEDEIPYQSDHMEPIIPVTELELIHGLADHSLFGDVDRVIVPNNDPMVQDVHSISEDEEEEEIYGDENGDENMDEQDDDNDNDVDDDDDDNDENDMDYKTDSLRKMTGQYHGTKRKKSSTNAHFRLLQPRDLDKATKKLAEVNKKRLKKLGLPSVTHHFSSTVQKTPHGVQTAPIVVQPTRSLFQEIKTPHLVQPTPKLVQSTPSLVQETTTMVQPSQVTAPTVVKKTTRGVQPS